jgi:hypothetical protein
LGIQDITVLELGEQKCHYKLATGFKWGEMSSAQSLLKAQETLLTKEKLLSLQVKLQFMTTKFLTLVKYGMMMSRIPIGGKTGQWFR